MTVKRVIKRIVLIVAAVALTAGIAAIKPAYETKAAGHTGLVQGYDGGWYYLVNGKVAQNYTSLVYYNGGWFYVKKGKIDWSANTLSQVNGHGQWWKVTNGMVDWWFTGFTYFNGNWWLVRNGQIDWTYRGIAQGADGGWYYVKNGCVDWKATGLTNYYGNLFYIKNGKLDWSFTGIVKYNSGYWYVKKGMVDRNSRGKVKYKGYYWNIYAGRAFKGAAVPKTKKTSKSSKPVTKKASTKKKTTKASSSSSKKHTHQWVRSASMASSKIKDGYGCNGCSRDVTSWADLYACCGGWHTHRWILFPEYYECKTCDVKLHKHEWYYVKPTYIIGTNEIGTPGYWMCSGCANQSRDGKTSCPVEVSKNGFKRGAIDKSHTPYDFAADKKNKWLIIDEYWQKPEKVPALERIDVSGSCSYAPGDKVKYQVVFTPASAAESVSWKSSNTAVATVDNTGTCTAKKAGTATITATTKSGQTDSVFIRVTAENIGSVKSAAILVDGKTNPNGFVEIEELVRDYSLTLRTVPSQAVYSVTWSIEGDKKISFTKPIHFGDDSSYSWEHSPKYTNPATMFNAGPAGDVTIVATIYDKTGKKTVVKQPVRLIPMQ